MKKKVWIGIYIVFALIIAKLLFQCLYNEAVIAKYNSGDYSVDVGALKILNWYQPYIVHYNDGNIAYRNQEFDKAIEDYSKALALNPPKDKECSIRINMALAMIGRMGDDFDAPENIDNSIAQLKAARDVLLADKCATEYGDGHSETAEQLKKEIDDMLLKLQKQKEKGSSAGEEGSGSSNDESAEDALENSLKEELQQIQTQAYIDRKEESQFIEEIQSEMNFDYDDPIW